MRPLPGHFLFSFAEDLTDKKGFIGRNAIEPEGNHFPDILLFVHDPGIDRHPQFVGPLDPFGMVLKCPEIIIQAIEAGPPQRIGIGPAADILDAESGGNPGVVGARGKIPADKHDP